MVVVVVGGMGAALGGLERPVVQTGRCGWTQGLRKARPGFRKKVSAQKGGQDILIIF